MPSKYSLPQKLRQSLYDAIASGEPRCVLRPRSLPTPMPMLSAYVRILTGNLYRLDARHYSVGIDDDSRLILVKNYLPTTNIVSVEGLIRPELLTYLLTFDSVVVLNATGRSRVVLTTIHHFKKFFPTKKVRMSQIGADLLLTSEYIDATAS
jgi:hypothetical protein